MEPKIAVVVQIDLDGRHVQIVVTGAVTELNQQGLYPVIERARGLVPGTQVSVDLTGAQYVEPAAVDLLRWAVEHEDVVTGARPVEIMVVGPEAAPVAEAVPTVNRSTVGTSSQTQVSS